MRRTEVLQEYRQMRFEKVYSGWRSRELTQEQAANILGVSARTFPRLIPRYDFLRTLHNHEPGAENEEQQQRGA